MPDIKPAAFAARADQPRRHLHLVERLVPDVVEPVGRAHARTDAGIDEIEEEQPRTAAPAPCAPAAASRRRRRRGRPRRSAPRQAHPSTPACLMCAARARRGRRACWSRRSRAGRAQSSVKRDARSVMTGSQVSQNSGQPCNNSSGGPAPVRATWKSAPLARIVWCSIIGVPSLGSLRRHARPCAGHPRLCSRCATKTWMAGTSPAMTRKTNDFSPRIYHSAPCLGSIPRLLHRRPRGLSPDFGAWRGGRVVECTALEMRHRCKPIGGSNPSLSASRLRIPHDATPPEPRKHLQFGSRRDAIHDCYF